jgi:Lipase (class 3)
MAFALPLAADGTPIPCAALQYISLVAGCYWNRQDVVAEVVSQVGGGSILGFRYEPITWPPSWTVCRSGDTIVICFAGTDTIPHVFGDVTGALGTLFQGGPVQAHAFFLSSWETLRPTILGLMPADVNTCDVIFTGHSMGAAELFLASLDFARGGVGRSVHLLTFSPAKSLTRGFQGPLPIAPTFLAPFDDCVPFLPPTGGMSAVLGGVTTWLYGVPVDWTHYEQGFTYNGTAGFTRQPADTWDSWPTPRTIAASPNSHTTINQGRILAQIVANEPMDASCAAIRQTLLDLFETPGPPSVFFPPNPAAFVDFAFQNREIFSQTVPPALTTKNVASVNTLNVALTQLAALNANAIFSAARSGGSTMPLIGAAKITFYYTDNLGGFSESWYCANGLTAVTVANLAAYLNLRLDISGKQTTFQYCRISLVGSPRVVQIYYPQEITGLVVFTGTAGLARNKTVVVNSDFSNTCLLVRRGNGNIYSFWFMRGLPDVIVEDGGVYTPQGASNFANSLNALFTAIQALGWGFVGRTPAQQAVLPLNAITINPQDGTGIFTVGGATGFPVNNPLNPTQGPYNYRLAVRLRRINNPRQANGPYTVTVLNQTTANTLDSFPYVGYTSTGVGQLVYNVPQLIVPNSFNPEKIAGRKTGRPFGLRAGRARSRLAR